MIYNAAVRRKGAPVLGAAQAGELGPFGRLSDETDVRGNEADEESAPAPLDPDAMRALVRAGRHSHPQPSDWPTPKLMQDPHLISDFDPVPFSTTPASQQHHAE